MSSFTVDSLGSQLLGEIPQHANAAGSVPERVLENVREALTAIWLMEDWRFRSKTATLSFTAGDETAALPDDFEKLDQKWVKENNNNRTLIVTDSLSDFEHYRPVPISSGAPSRMLLEPDPDEAFGFRIRARLDYQPVKALSYPVVYLTRSPTELQRSRYTVTFTDVPADGDTITINDRLYEFDPSGDDIDAGSDVEIDTDGLTTVAEVIDACVTAFNADSDGQVLAYDNGDDSELVLVSKDSTSLTCASSGANHSGTVTIDNALPDSAAPRMPDGMFQGWHDLASVRCLRQFTRDERYKENWASFQHWLRTQKALLDEEMVSSTPMLRDGYGDINAFASSFFYRWNL